MNACVSFGWEAQTLNNNGADIFFRVARNMTLISADLDAAVMLNAPFPNPASFQVLCQASVCRGAAPTISGTAGYLPESPSADFGAAQRFDPSSLVQAFNGHMLQDVFYSVILKAFAPYEGSTSRHVPTQPNLQLNAGDFLVFHMDHAGAGPVDGEMQVVLTYI